LVAILASAAAAKIGGGDVAFLVKEKGKVVFSHERHVQGQNLGCTACHDSLYVTSGKRAKATMAQMRKGKSCGACHDGKKAFSVKGDCNTCHKK
jgi:c(7)-type cytochrome triheme protein